MATIAHHRPHVWRTAGEGSRGSGNWALWLGIVLILAGFLAIALPFISSMAVTVIVGIFLLAAGVVHIVDAIRQRHERHMWAPILLGLVTLAAGVIMLWNPLVGMMSLTLFLGAYFIVEGVIKVGWSIALRRLRGWGWMLASGVVSIILGLVIFGYFPQTAAWLLGTLLGIDLIMGGSVLIALSSARSAMEGATGAVGGRTNAEATHPIGGE